MSLSRAREDVSKRFSYKKDQGEDWQILSDDGPIEGDCEDHVATTFYVAAGRSKILFWFYVLIHRYTFWYCRTENGEGHCVGYAWGEGWTDNRIPRVVPDKKYYKDLGYKFYFPYPAPVIVLKFLLKPVLKKVSW